MYFLEKYPPAYYCEEFVHLGHYVQVKKNLQLIALWGGRIPQAQTHACKGLSTITPAVDKFVWIKESHHMYIISMLSLGVKFSVSEIASEIREILCLFY
jgi:hypothetical protein